MLKDATVVGQLVVVEQDTGVQLSKELVAVSSEANMTRAQIEDLMTEAATCLETLKVNGTCTCYFICCADSTLTNFTMACSRSTSWAPRYTFSQYMTQRWQGRRCWKPNSSMEGSKTTKPKDRKSTR